MDNEFNQLSMTEPDISLGKLALIMRIFSIDYTEFSMHRELYNNFYEMLKLLGDNAYEKYALFTLLNRYKAVFEQANQYKQVYHLIQKGELVRAERIINRILKR